MKRHILILCSCVIALGSCHSQKVKSIFAYRNTDQGVELLEDGNPVFFYQEKPKSLDGNYICNNYLHPLYSLTGDTLTEEFPVDHPYHRGIYWAWHQMYVDGKSLGDGWIMENISQDVKNVQTNIKNNSAEIKINAAWKSTLFENNRSFLAEKTTITVHSLQNGIRKIDFVISLQALVPGVEIGGSDDEKGYGGFCARLKLPDDLTFISDYKSVTPEVTQVVAGPWMDFSASFGRNGETSGVAILCHPETPNYPALWILRAKTSMQNIVYPGRNPVKIQLNKPINLYYRLIIHNGNADSIDLNQLQNEYEKQKFLSDKK